MSTSTAPHLPSNLTVPYILGYFKEECSNDEEKGFSETIGADWTDEDVLKRLQSHGVAVEEDAQQDASSQDLRRKALLNLLDCNVKFSFWQVHHSLHPNARRVKNWLWVHERYRNQANQLLGDAKEQDPNKLYSDFRKFHKKIESHSLFEDTQLFQFFTDSKIGDQEALRKLKEQHSDSIRSVDALQDGLEKLISGTGETYESSVQEHLEKYVQDMMEHLDLEEKTIVGPWLRLTDEEYQKYRSYLSWTYCVMY